MRIIVWSLAVSIILSPASLLGAPKDPAELFPADTVAYLEICQPGAAAKDLAAFFKGSMLENALPALDQWREKHGLGVRDAGILATFLGPEMLKEANRFHGVAVALTGFDKRGEPECTAVVLTGDSQLPGFLMRKFLASHPTVHKLEAIDDVSLYVEQVNQFVEDRLNGAAPRPAAINIGPIYAFEPGIILIGSNKEHVANAVRRWKQKERSESLAGNAAFKKAAEQRQTPGLFLFADARRLLERQTALVLKRQTGPARGRSGLDSLTTELFRRLLPPAGVETLTARLEFKPQGLDLRGSLKLDPKSSNPLAHLLAGPGLEVADLDSFMKDAPFAVALNLPAGERRLPRLLDFLDQLAKATGTLGPTASEIVKELEEKKILAAQALAKIDRISMVMPPLASWPKEGLPLPTFVLHAESGQSLESLEAAIPAILELLGGNKAEPVTETVDGVKVRSLESKASPMGTRLHYARRDKLFAVGIDRRLVAACVMAEPARSFAAEPEIAEALKSGGKPTLLAAWNWNALPPLPKPEKSKPKTAPPVPIDIEGPDPSSVPFAPGGRPTAPVVPSEVFEDLRGLPPLVVTLSSQDGELRLQLRQRDPRNLRAAAIHRWFEWFVKFRSTMNGEPYYYPPQGFPGER